MLMNELSVYLMNVLKIATPIILTIVFLLRFVYSRFTKYLDSRLEKSIEVSKSNLILIQNLQKNVFENCREINRLSPIIHEIINKEGLAVPELKNEFIRNLRILEDKIRDTRIFLDENSDNFDLMHRWKESAKAAVQFYSNNADEYSIAKRFVTEKYQEHLNAVRTILRTINPEVK